MSASIFPPPSSRPGLAKCYAPSLGVTARSGPELKAEAIRLHPLTGYSKRQLWKKYEGGTRGWTTIQRYLDPNYPLSYPTTRFVQWLNLLAQQNALSVAASEFEAASR